MVGPIQVAEPLLDENPDRFCMFPIKYREVWEMYKKAEASFWTGVNLFRRSCGCARVRHLPWQLFALVPSCAILSPSPAWAASDCTQNMMGMALSASRHGVCAMCAFVPLLTRHVTMLLSASQRKKWT